MVRLLTIVGVLAAGVALSSGPAGAQGDKPPTVKEIMGKLNKGPNSLTPTLGKDLRADPPDWEHLQKEAKTFTALVGDLQKNRPPKGDAASWDKLTKAYAENARLFEAAVDKKDKKEAQSAIARLADMKGCSGCHGAHRN